MRSMEILSGTKPLWLFAALLLGGGPLLGALSGSVGVAAVVFGIGAVLLGIGQFRASESRAGRYIGVVLVLGGASTVVDAGIWMLSGAGI